MDAFSGTSSTVAGDGVEGALTDVSVTSSAISYPLYLVIDLSDNVYVSLDTGSYVRKFTFGGNLVAYTGGGSTTVVPTAIASAGITANSASIGQALGLALDTYQNFYVVDHSNGATLVIGGRYSTSVTGFQYSSGVMYTLVGGGYT